MSSIADVTVIGGGIVGLATALALSERHPGARLVVLEKEAGLARHQSGHNSGVIHSGIYYKPGSYKARQCVEGARLLTEFCDAHGIRYERCGKVIVATDEAELPRLQALHERGTANGVPGLKLLGPEEVREHEPHVRALRGLLSPWTGIIDFVQVAEAIATDLRARGVTILTGARVARARRTLDGLVLEGPRIVIPTRRVINCAGLHSDRVARLMGARPDVRIVPFRGEYYMLKPERRYLVRNLVYPVPDPEFPFLGVHFTRTIHGDVEAGPNAVLAFAREGYTRVTVRPGEALGTLAYPGLWAMARRYWKTGAYEFYRSVSKTAFVRSLQRLVPELQAEDIVPGGAGVRAQAVSPDGSLVDDFRIAESPDAIHVVNAPSPGATASLAIGRHIADLAAKSWALPAR
jgi:L-2-hydroxyglutarate oxidase